MKIAWKHEFKKNETVDPKKIIRLILKNRGIQNADEFLYPVHPLSIHLSDFGFKKEMKKTIALLEKIKKNNGMIVVYTDYDADGITGGAILWETLHLLGFTVIPYVPHRKLEGYGFSKKGIDSVKKQFDPALIISVDHGITARDKITYAKTQGIPVIVTDHHVKPEKLPMDAVAIFHIPKLSGSGVSYFFSKFIFDHFKHSSLNAKLLGSRFESDYCALASIGTVADLVPLIGPSRSIVTYGLAAFPKSKRPGLVAIRKEAGIENRTITTYEIGYIIAPRINAVGRLEHAIDALRLLCTNDPKKAHDLAHRVGEKNTERQDMVTAAIEEARLRLKASAGKRKKLPKIIVLVSEKWHEGIIGLIASRIAEEYFRPTIVITQSETHMKGSARSIPSVHITEFLRNLKNYLVDVGGHKGAAGFTMEKKWLDVFTKKALEHAEKNIPGNELERMIEADIKIPISSIRLSWVKELEKLQPFGIGTPEPMFYSEGTLRDMKIFGKKENHLRLSIRESGTSSIDMVAFNKADRITSLVHEQTIKVVYTIGVNRWNNQIKLQGRIVYLS